MEDERTTGHQPTPTRRLVLSAGAAGVAAAALAACGGVSGESSESGSADDGADVGGAGTPGDGGPASAVPVGGAAIVAVNDTAYVVAQPSEGEFVAHSAVCPHQGCLCNAIVDGNAVCPCHGSEFDSESGEVRKGPATKGLAAASVTVAEGSLQLS